jgi:DNA-binding LacI/PurR family transcriptional regulator
MLDVAARAGVSVATVSNTINGTRRVDETTRLRVERAIQDLGYVRNMSARRFRTGQSNTLAVFSSSIATHATAPARLGLSMEVAAATSLYAWQKGFSVLTIPPSRHPRKALEAIDIDGALLVEPPAGDQLAMLMAERDIPVVSIGKPIGTDIPFVDLRSYDVAQLLTKHLIDIGVRQIGLLMGDSERYFNMTMEHAVLAQSSSAHIRKVSETASAKDVREALESLLSEIPDIDGLIATTTGLASAAMAVLQDLGKSIPQDIAVVTRYDGPRAWESSPALTAVNMHVDQASRTAVDMLLAAINGNSMTDQDSDDYAAPELVIRASSRR